MTRDEIAQDAPGETPPYATLRRRYDRLASCQGEQTRPGRQPTRDVRSSAAATRRRLRFLSLITPVR